MSVTLLLREKILDSTFQANIYTHTKSQLQNKMSVLGCSMIKVTVVNQTQNPDKKASLNSIVFRVNFNISMYGVGVWCEYMYVKLTVK